MHKLEIESFRRITMSSKTKIVVLKARELIYTGIFILLGILLILLLIFMFVPSHKSKKAKETSGYTQGVYSSPLKLGENHKSQNAHVLYNQF